MGNLFSPLPIAGITVTNRVVMAPFASGYAALDGFVGEALYNYYLARAHGGVGLILTEPAYVVPPAKDVRAHLGIYSDLFVPSLRRLARSIRGGGSRVLLTLEAPALLAEGTEADVQALTEKFLCAAWRVHAASFDGVLLSSTDGGVLQALISPLSNRRNDSYGSGGGNRLRLALEIIEGIRRMLGPRFVIGFRLLAEEFAEQGIKLQDARLTAGRLVGAGVNLLDVMTDSRTEVMIARFPGWRIPLANSIKRVTPDTPVIGSGLLGDPHLADSVVRDGSVDLVMLGRSLRTNPYWPHLARIVLASHNGVEQEQHDYNGVFGTLS